MQINSKKIEILDAAQLMIQKRGYNGFSYADISKSVGIRKASIHHHFPSKSSLAVAVIRRYREDFNQHLSTIFHRYADWQNKIRHYAKLYEDVLLENKLCLCGMLSSEIETLPSMLKKELNLFFKENVEWLACVMGELHKSFSTKRLHKIAWNIISTLQGALMMARMQNDLNVFSFASEELYTSLAKIK